MNVSKTLKHVGSPLLSGGNQQKGVLASELANSKVQL